MRNGMNEDEKFLWIYGLRSMRTPTVTIHETGIDSDIKRSLDSLNYRYHKKFADGWVEFKMKNERRNN